MQTSYSDAPAIGRVGAKADSRIYQAILTRIASGLVAVGRSVFRVPNYGAPGQNSTHGPGIVYQEPDPAAAADVDAIMLSESLTAAAASFDAADADGVVGADIIVPARKLTIVTNSHADWDVGNAVITFYNSQRELVSETIAMADAGNQTLTTTDVASEFVSLSLPTGSGTNRTFTVGISVLDATVNLADWEGVVLYDPMAGGGITPSTESEYEDGDTLAVMRKGAVWVVTEDACSAGGDVFTRISGSGDIGAFRSDADGGAAIQITGARWGRTSAVGALNIVELY